MNEKDRVDELSKYQIMDSIPEKQFDDLVKLLADIYKVPIAYIAFMDSHRQYFKAKIGISMNEMPRDLSFCKYLIESEQDTLTINDAVTDLEFSKHPLVNGTTNIRFYSGAALIGKNGNKIGSICIQDYEARNLSDHDLETLKVMGSHVVKLLNERLENISNDLAIMKNDKFIEKISDYSPGALFKFQITNAGEMSFPFVSKGISLIHPGLTPEMLKTDAVLGFNTIHPEDLPKVYESIGNSFKTLSNLDFEFRIKEENGNIKWHRAKANPEKREDRVVWYGTLQDITESKEYIETLEEIMFSISHIIRRPVTTLMGLVQVLNDDVITEDKLRELTVYFNTVTKEMDEYTLKLSDAFYEKKVKISTKQMFVI